MVNIFKKIFNILKGTIYNIFGIKQDLAQKRIIICNGCQFKKTKPIIGDICGECGCILESKTRVKDEKCELNKW